MLNTETSAIPSTPSHSDSQFAHSSHQIPTSQQKDNNESDMELDSSSSSSTSSSDHEVSRKYSTSNLMKFGSDLPPPPPPPMF